MNILREIKRKHPWLNLLLPPFENLEARIVALS